MKKNTFNQKMSEIRFQRTEFITYDVGQATSARITQKRDDNNEAIEGTIAKICLEVCNYKTLQMILKDGGDISDLATITLEFVADEEILKKYNLEDIIGKLIDLRETEVALKWVARGKSGNWQGFKLVTDTLKLVNMSTTKSE